MRAIEKDMWRVINARESRKFGNMEVCYQPSTGNSFVYLFGNHIATYERNEGKCNVNIDTLLAWPTKTTISRLRALGSDIRTIKGVMYLDGFEV